VWVALTIIVCVVIATGFMCYLSSTPSPQPPLLLPPPLYRERLVKLLTTDFLCCVWPALGAMLSNACDDTRQGLTMGLNQSSSSLFRCAHHHQPPTQQRVFF
jgi:hypothetical protein